MKEAQDSPNIVHYYGVYLKDTTLLLVMEFCGGISFLLFIHYFFIFVVVESFLQLGGSVLDLMLYCKLTLSEEQIAAITQQMIEGLAYLHSKHIIHRDLKAANILLTNDGVVKLADFGVSNKIASTIQKRRTVVGSPYWMVSKR
jgi:serine/threonine protein kinase